MPTAKITFHNLEQISQLIDAVDKNKEHVIAKASFTLELPEGTFPDMSVMLRHPFGTRFRGEPLEVDRPTGSYQGNWSYSAFRDIVEDYCRSRIGETGSGFKIVGGSNNLFVGNQIRSTSQAYQMEISEE